MIDFFGLQAKRVSQYHMKKIVQLQMENDKLKQIVELQSQKIEHLKNDTGHILKYMPDIDYPNSRKG